MVTSRAVSPPGTQKYTLRAGRPPPKARFVLCHYEQPHSWLEIAATVTANEVSWTQWQEAVISTTVGSCPLSQPFALCWLCSTLLADGYTDDTLSLTNAVGSLRGTDQVPTASSLSLADPLSPGTLLAL